MRKRKRWIIFLLGYALYCAVYVCRFNLTIASAFLEEAGILSVWQYGMLCGAFSVTYSVGRLINGFLGDRVDARVMICGGILTAGAANLFMGIFPPYPAMLVFWAINGYAQSMIWGPLLQTVSRMFPGERRGFISSFFASSVSLGSALGILIASVAVARCGLAWAFYLPSVFALALGGACLVAFRGVVRPPGASRASVASISHLARVLPVTIPAFFHGWIKDNVGNWAALLMYKRYSFNLEGISGFVLLVPLVGLVGRFAYPFLYSRLGGRERLVSALGFGITIFASAMLCLPIPVEIAAVCLCVIAAAISLVNTSMLTTYPLRFSETGQVSSVSGLLDFATYLGSGISAAIYGAIISDDGGGFVWMFLSWMLVSGISILAMRARRRSDGPEYAEEMESVERAPGARYGSAEDG